MGDIRYNGITIHRLSDLFNKDGICRAFGISTWNADLNYCDERFAQKQVRNIKDSELTNINAVINLALTVYPRLHINDLKGGVIYEW